MAAQASTSARLGALLPKRTVVMGKKISKRKGERVKKSLSE
jgi:hypothetical protein